MDDHEYALTGLFGILTRPDGPGQARPGAAAPTGSTASDGFGTVLRGACPITVVPGQHGSQIQVALRAPPARRTSTGPADGALLLLPLDAEWRELSGLG